MADRVTFTPGSADRIAKVVRIVEAGNRDATGYVASPRLQGGGGGTPVRLAVWTATSSWFPIAPWSTSPTTTAHVRTVQFVYPTATVSVGTATIGVANGATVRCINNMAFLGAVSTATAIANRIVLVSKEAGEWRLIGGSI